MADCYTLPFPSQIRICSETGVFLNPHILGGIFFFLSIKACPSKTPSPSCLADMEIVHSGF